MSIPYPETLLAEVHSHSIKHKNELLSSEICGCFYCLATFHPQTIREWTDKDATALCPHCGIDSVIGSASGYLIESSLLKAMKDHYF